MWRSQDSSSPEGALQQKWFTNWGKYHLSGSRDHTERNPSSGEGLNSTLNIEDPLIKGSLQKSTATPLNIAVLEMVFQESHQVGKGSTPHWILKTGKSRGAQKALATTTWNHHLTQISRHPCFWRCHTTRRVQKLGRKSNFPLGSRDRKSSTCGTEDPTSRPEKRGGYYSKYNPGNSKISKISRFQHSQRCLTTKRVCESWAKAFEDEAQRGEEDTT